MEETTGNNTDEREVVTTPIGAATAPTNGNAGALIKQNDKKAAKSPQGKPQPPKKQSKAPPADLQKRELIDRKRNLKFEINQLYTRVRREGDGRKKSEMHKKLIALKKMLVQRKGHAVNKALLRAIKKQKTREAQLMTKRLKRWTQILPANKEADGSETKLPPKDEVERITKQVGFLKQMTPEDFLPWISRIYKGKQATKGGQKKVRGPPGPIDKDQEAAVKRILKAKFVREEYDKLHEQKEKERLAKQQQKDKREQRQRGRKRKREDPETPAAKEGNVDAEGEEQEGKVGEGDEEEQGIEGGELENEQTEAMELDEGNEETERAEAVEEEKLPEVQQPQPEQKQEEHQQPEEQPVREQKVQDKNKKGQRETKEATDTNKNNKQKAKPAMKEEKPKKAVTTTKATPKTTKPTTKPTKTTKTTPKTTTKATTKTTKAATSTTAKGPVSMFLTSLSGKPLEYSDEEEEEEEVEVKEEVQQPKQKKQRVDRPAIKSKNDSKAKGRPDSKRTSSTTKAPVKKNEPKKEEERKGNKRLHPSWEAKKALKDKQRIDNFAGKKIKFND